MSDLKTLQQQAQQSPDTYWGENAQHIHWFQPFDRVLNDDNPPFYTWFTGGRTNACYNAIDRHVFEGRGDQTAIIYDSPVTDTKSKISYKQLQDEVARVAFWLQMQGVSKGDVVLIYMPMIPQAAMAMLACARIGAIHNVVFGGFAPRELQLRIDHSNPNVIITASCGVEPKRIVEYQNILEQALQSSVHKVKHLLIYDRSEHLWQVQQQRDTIWQQTIPQMEKASVVPVESEHPLYILYTSGSTGMPKGVRRDTGGYITALKWSMTHIYDIQAGEVYWSASDVGWVVGHSYIVYAPLLHGCTTVMFEGKPVGTPDAGVFWRIIDEYKVSCLFTAPTAIRAIKREDYEGGEFQKYTLNSLRTLFLAGERCDPDTLYWLQDRTGKPVIDHWWQTETGWAIAANCWGIERQDIRAGSPTTAVPGYQVEVLGKDKKPLPAGVMGEICIKLPLPPGCLQTIWNDDGRFINSYLSEFPGYYQTGDAGIIDEDGYIYVMSRSDDIINVAGHRLSTGAMEEVLSEYKDVAECAVVAKKCKIKGHRPVGFVVLKSGLKRDAAALEKALKQTIRDHIGPIADMDRVYTVPLLPKTRSGKVLRGTLRKMVDGEQFTMPNTIENPTAIDNIQSLLNT